MKARLPLAGFALVEAATGSALVLALLLEGHAWRRWGLLLIALAVALIVRSRGVVIWLDVVLIGLVLGAVAVAVGIRPANKTPPSPPKPPAPVTFMLPAAKIVAAQGIASGAKGVVILLDPLPTRGASGFEAHRYAVTFQAAVQAGQAKGPLAVAVARGSGDATASKFAAQLYAAAQVVVLPARTH